MLKQNNSVIPQHKMEELAKNSKNDLLNFVEEFFTDHDLSSTVENNCSMLNYSLELNETANFSKKHLQDVIYENNKLIIFLTKLKEKCKRFEYFKPYLD